MPSPPQSAPRDRGVGVELRGVRKVFAGDRVAVDRIDLDVAPGDFVALLGPSGCGKSTLLRLVAGLEQPDAGTVRVDDAPARAPHAASIAFVFQDAHLLPWRTVLGNVSLPLELRGVAKAPRLASAKRALARVGLEDAIDQVPAELSGGMRMRVSLARALVTEPSLLLLDEPFAALDELSRQRLDDDLRALWRDLGMTVLFVTHAVAEAAYLAERAVVLSARPARILLDHRIDLPRERDASLRTDPSFAAPMRALHDALARGAS